MAKKTVGYIVERDKGGALAACDEIVLGFCDTATAYPSLRAASKALNACKRVEADRGFAWTKMYGDLRIVRLVSA